MGVTSALAAAAVPTQPIASRRNIAIVLTVALVLTGAAGLMYQVVWFRLLGQTFGVTVHATAAVLAAFMAGLAIGSLVAARFAPRLRNPLAAYGLAEAVIGVAGLLSLGALDALRPLYVSLVTALPGFEAGVTAVRFASAFAIMLVPTTLMGATLPIVIEAVDRGWSSTGRLVSWLYGVNTFGAIAGTLLAGFYLIGLIGITNTAWVAASCNFAAAAVAVAMSRRAAARRGVLPATPAPPLERPVPRRAGAVVLVAYGVSGAVALALEVVWTRVLAGIFPGTTYSFSIMLGCVLAGIAIGSWLANPLLARARNWISWFVGLEIALGATALLSVFVLSQVYVIEPVLRDLVASEDWLTRRPQFMAAFAAAVIGPSAIMMGMTFPVATRIFLTGRRPGEGVGLVYGVNVIGSTLGSLAGGLVLIPLLGAQGSILLLAAGNILAGLAVALAAPGIGGRRLTWALAGAGVFTLGWLATPSLYDRIFSTIPNGERTLWYHEGQDATVRVGESRDGLRILFINSESQGADGGPSLAFHHRIGHWGSLLHPNPEHVLVIGLGIGATPGAAALHPGSSIDLVELHAGVIPAARLFNHVNFGVLDRPNVHLTVTDGRNHLLIGGRQYDIIQADPIQPYNAGAANLYSAEFYALARDHLRDDGLMVQWVNTNLPDYSYRMLIRTFLSAFPDATLWHSGSILVGSKGSLRLDRATIAARLAVPAVRASLLPLGVSSVEDVLGDFSAGPDELRRFAGDGPLQTDRTPFVEFFWTIPSAERVVIPQAWRGRHFAD